MASERAKRAAEYAPIFSSDETKRIVSRLQGIIGDKRTELKALGLPQEDLGQAIAWAKSAGMNPDDMTYGDVHEWIVSTRSEVIAKRSIAFFDAIDTAVVQPAPPVVADRIPACITDRKELGLAIWNESESTTWRDVCTALNGTAEPKEDEIQPNLNNPFPFSCSQLAGDAVSNVALKRAQTLGLGS